MSAPILAVRSLRKSFGALCVTDDVSLDLTIGELHAIIGPNGAGKTSLINQLSGGLAADAGQIFFAGRDVTGLSMARRSRIGIARTFQITSLLPAFSVLENAALAAQVRAGSSFRFFRPAASERDLNDRAMAALETVGLAARAGRRASDLSHGEQRQLELAMALATEPRLLLLDEPLAGTGHDESAMLIDLMQRLKRRFPIMLIEHDMDAVFALADRISVLVDGRIVASGALDEIRADPSVRAAYLGDEAA